MVLFVVAVVLWVCAFLAGEGSVVFIFLFRWGFFSLVQSGFCGVKKWAWHVLTKQIQSDLISFLSLHGSPALFSSLTCLCLQHCIAAHFQVAAPSTRSLVSSGTPTS